MLYRILTEDKNHDKIVKIVNRKFDGFTLLTGIGYWRGKPEICLIIEISAPDLAGNRRKVIAIVQRIKKLNDQEYILLQKIDCRSELI